MIHERSWLTNALAVALFEEIADEHIVLGTRLVDLALDEIGDHLARRHLVVTGGIGLELLDREAVAREVGTIDDGVAQEDLDEVAHELLALIPKDGIMIECHARVEGVIDERVAHGLHVAAEGPYMVEGVDLTIDGVGLDVEGDNLERVGMHEEGVALGVVDGHTTVGTKGLARVLVVFAVVAREFVAVDGIDIDHIAEGLTEAHVTVVIDAVANEHLTVVAQYGTVHQTGLLEFGIVIAHLGVDMTLARGDVGGTDDMGHGVAVVVVEGVGGDGKTDRSHPQA